MAVITESNKAINRSSSFSLQEKRTLREAFDAVGDITTSQAAQITTLNTIPHGSYYFSTPAATANAAATPIKAAGTTTAVLADGFTHANNRLTLDTGRPSIHANVCATVSLTKANATATTITLYLYRNGSLITGSTVDFTSTAVAATIYNMVLQSNVLLNATDYVELWCATANGDDITITKGVVSVTPLSLV